MTVYCLMIWPSSFRSSPQPPLSSLRPLPLLDAPTWLRAGPEKTFFAYRATAEHFFQAVVKRSVLLYTKIVADYIQCDVRHVADGRHVAGAMPCCLHAKMFAKNRDLASWSKASSLRNMTTDVVNQPFGDQRRPFVRAVEEFAHGDRRRTLLPDLAEVRDILGG